MEYAIGTSFPLTSLQDLPLSWPMRSTPELYSITFDRGDGSVAGHGWPVTVWEFQVLTQAELGQLLTLCTVGGVLQKSRQVYLRTRTPENHDQFDYYSAVMVLPAGLTTARQTNGLYFNIKVEFRKLQTVTPVEIDINSVSFTPNGDGTYTLAVNVTIDGEQDLTLTAGSQTATATITGTGNLTIADIASTSGDFTVSGGVLVIPVSGSYSTEPVTVNTVEVTDLGVGLRMLVNVTTVYPPEGLTLTVDGVSDTETINDTGDLSVDVPYSPEAVDVGIYGYRITGTVSQPVSGECQNLITSTSISGASNKMITVYVSSPCWVSASLTPGSAGAFIGDSTKWAETSCQIYIASTTSPGGVLITAGGGKDSVTVTW